MNLELRDHFLKVWSESLAVVQHLNDLCLRLRNFAITVLGAFIAASAIAFRYGGILDVNGYSFHVAAVFLSIGLICWMGLYFLDRFWYHVLLRAAVGEAQKLENELAREMPYLHMTTAMSNASRASLGMNAGAKLDFFYLGISLVMLIATVLVASGTAQLRT